MLCLILCIFLSTAVSAQDKSLAIEEKSIDKDYIKKHFPDIYEQIYMEGKESGIKEAESQKKPDVIAGEKEVEKPKKQELDDWWNRSSLEYDPLLLQFLFHGELQYSYLKTTGNMDSFSHLMSARLDIRKYRFTNSIAIQLDKNEINTAFAGHTEKDHRIFEDDFKYDITKRLYADAGFIWEKNSLTLTDGRYAVYGGFGYRLLNLQKHKLEVLLDYGYLNEKYTSDIERLLNFDSRDFETVFFDQKYIWAITKRINFNEKFRIIYFLNKTDDFGLDAFGNAVKLGKENRKLIYFSTGLDFGITDSFAITNSYQINYDSMPWPGVKKKDTILTTGVKFSF